jgi:hypothetical protein
MEGTTKIVKPTKLWFDEKHICIETDAGKTMCQSLKWYPILRKATPEQRENYKFTDEGIRWKNIDEDVSFESFEYDNHDGK